MADIIGSGNKKDKWTKKVTDWINWLNEKKQVKLVAGDNVTLTPQQDGTVEISAEGGPVSLNDLSDVDTQSPQDGQVLKYNSTTQKWENGEEGFVNAARVIHVKGKLIYDANNHISGIGCATITLNNGVATIDFALQITGSSASADEFAYGISRDLLKALNPAVPDITPVNGGFWDFYGYNSTLIQIAPAFQASDNLWKFARYYENTMAAMGNWPSRVFSNGNHLHGVIYGNYEDTNIWYTDENFDAYKDELDNKYAYKDE